MNKVQRDGAEKKRAEERNPMVNSIFEGNLTFDFHGLTILSG